MVKSFLKGLGLAAAAGAVGYAGQNIGHVVSGPVAGVISSVLAMVAGYLVNSPRQQ